MSKNKFVSMEEKQDHKNESASEMMDAFKKVKNYLSPELMEEAQALMQKVLAFNVNVLPRDDIIKTKKWTEDNAPYLKKEDLKEALDKYFIYKSEVFTVSLQTGDKDSEEYNEMLFNYKDEFVRGLKLVVEEKDYRSFELYRETSLRSEMWRMGFVMIPGYFFVNYDCGRTHGFSGFFSNDQLYEALAAVSKYFGFSIADKDGKPENNSWN